MKLRPAPFQDLCRELGAPLGGETFFGVEDADGVLFAGHLPKAGQGAERLEIQHEGRRALVAVAAGANAARWLPLFHSQCRTELEHQATVQDMAAATAHLWRQTNALLRMMSAANVEADPADVVRQVLAALPRSTALGTPRAYVRLPDEDGLRIVGEDAEGLLEAEALEPITGLSEEVRVVADRSADRELAEFCSTKLDLRPPIVLARLSTENASYGFTVAPVPPAELVKADDLKLFGAAAQILSVAMENAHTLARERETIRLQVANELLAAQTRDMEEVVHVVAHDLRAPMTSLYGHAHLALDVLHGGWDPDLPEPDPAAAEQLPEGFREAMELPLQGTAKSIERLNKMVQRLLDFSRVARMHYEIVDVDLAEVVREVVDSLGYQIQSGGVEVVLDSLPVVLGDRVHLEAVLQNLIDNALKYMGREGGRIHVGVLERSRTVEAVPAAGNGVSSGADASGDAVAAPTEDAMDSEPVTLEERVFFVADTGAGMTEAQAEKAFLPFRRFRKSAAPGDGIGLPYVRKVVERHGGRIWHEPTPGGGCTFCFTLGVPRAESA